MDKRLSIEDLGSLKMVHETMVRLGLPNLSSETLTAVGKQERDDFKKAIVRIANNEDGMNEHRSYIQSVTSLLSGAVMGALTALGYANVSRECLITLGKECGIEFREKLSGATRNDFESVQWIQKKMTDYGAGTSEYKNIQNQTASNQQRPVQHNSQANKTNVAQHREPSSQQSYTQARPSNNTNQSSARDYQQASQRTNEASSTKQASKQSSQSNSEREFFTMTFYGGKSALCFNATEKDGEHSINLDGGNKKPNQPEGGRAIDWSDKIVFGFSAEELIQLAWVLMGISKGCKFSGHGPLHDKSFQFELQAKGFFCSVSAKDKSPRAVPLSFSAAARLMFLVSRQIQKNYPNMSVTEVLTMLKMMAVPAQKVANG